MAKVLIVNEFHKLNTGYANYGEALLWGLSRIGDHEIAELACYAEPKEASSTNVPWRVYPGVPGEQEIEEYKSSPRNVFGEFMFERTCLHFQPDVVIAFRDFWMDNFINQSTYRNHFRHILMPACDAVPQNEQWLCSYAKADACFSYSDWGANVLRQESGGKIRVLGSASPSALPQYKVIGHQQAKNILSIDEDWDIIGTVMRNQRRKLYPDLFKSFRAFLDKTDNNNSYLYCHTSYPDHGWDFPFLLKYYNIGSRVLFTYICKNPECNHIEASLFSDAVKICPKCQQMSLAFPDVKKGLDHEQMAVVYNSMDLYVQYASSEGLGLPQMEALACGVPIATVNYSAMCDFINKCEAYPIEPIALYTELETGCQRAVPNNSELVAVLEKFCDLSQEERARKRIRARELFEIHFDIKDVVNKWNSAISAMDKPKLPWNAEPRIIQPNLNIPKGLNTVEFVKWCIKYILCEPENVGSYLESRMIRDINYGFSFTGNPEIYFNEDSNAFSRPVFSEFDRDKCVKFMLHMRNKHNKFEELRAKVLCGK